MKALSIRQPWAHLIAEGVKTIEVRSKPTKYRGPVLVCVSKTFRPVLIHGAYDRDWSKIPMWRREDMGQAIATVELVDCRQLVRGDEMQSCVEFAPDHWAWILSGVKKIEPFPVHGKLGLFDVGVIELSAALGASAGEKEGKR